MVYQRYQVLLSTCTDGWYKIILNSGTGEPHGKKIWIHTSHHIQRLTKNGS